MNLREVVRVWGYADNFELELTHKGGTKWETYVPPETKDGMYAVEIHAINRSGEKSYWNGVLYMCNGVCHLEIKPCAYQLLIKPRCTHTKQNLLFERGADTMCNNKAMTFFVGEKKLVSATVTPVNPDEVVVVISSEYKLTRGEETIESGPCEIKGADITALIETDEVGVYDLEISAQVGREKYINKIKVIVKE